MLSLRGIGKTFGGVAALTDVDFSLRAGEIHGLVGENGAGKSTCLGMAAGRIAPSSGNVLVDGRQLARGSPRAAKAAGVHAIYQELTIVPALSPEANVFLGQALSRRGWLREAEMRSRYERLCERPSVAATFAEYAAAAVRMPATVQAFKTGEKVREYRDHRLEWMIKSGGIEVVLAGLHDGTIRFSWPNPR